MSQKNVNNDIYETLGDRWYTAYDDPVALLRAESKAKTPWILAQIEKAFGESRNRKILDVGCGAGFLSNALATYDFQVTGVDLSPESLKVAKKYDATQKVSYLTADAYALPFEDASFDVITAMDFLEHIDNPEKVIEEFSRVLKPGGLFLFHTFNRNLLSGLVIIKFVEWFVKNTPKNMHVLHLFIKPQELQDYCEKAQMSVLAWTGIKPVFSSIPLKNLFSGIVPTSMRFQLTSSRLLSYMGCAKKKSLD